MKTESGNIGAVKVLMIGMHDLIGGIETYIMNYYRNIDRTKVQIDFINMYSKLCFQDEIVAAGGVVHNVTNVKKNPMKYKKQLMAILKEGKYDIVHVNLMSAANALPITVAKEAGVKTIIAHSHNSNTPKGLVRKIMHLMNKKKLVGAATDYFACSKLAGDWMFGNEISERGELIIIKNAIDTEKFKFHEEKRKDLRHKLNFQDKFVVGHIGRFEYQKNHEFLIDIFEKIYERNKNALLFLVGEGSLEEEIKNKVERLGLSSNVVFFGITNEIPDILQAIDVFVLPSRFEGLGIVAVEAQAAALKTFVADVVPAEAG